MQSYTGLDGHDFNLMQYWRANFSLPSCRGASCGSVYRVSTGEVLKVPKTSLRPSIVFLHSLCYRIFFGYDQDFWILSKCVSLYMVREYNVYFLLA